MSPLLNNISMKASLLKVFSALSRISTINVQRKNEIRIDRYLLGKLNISLTAR